MTFPILQSHEFLTFFENLAILLANGQILSELFSLSSKRGVLKRQPLVAICHISSPHSTSLSPVSSASKCGRWHITFCRYVMLIAIFQADKIVFLLFTFWPSIKCSQIIFFFLPFSLFFLRHIFFLLQWMLGREWEVHLICM